MEREKKPTRLWLMQRCWFCEPNTEPKWDTSFDSARYLVPIPKRKITKFWLAEPDTEPNLPVHLVRHNTLRRCLPTLATNPNLRNRSLTDCPWRRGAKKHLSAPPLPPPLFVSAAAAVQSPNKTRGGFNSRTRLFARLLREDCLADFQTLPPPQCRFKQDGNHQMDLQRKH